MIELKNKRTITEKYLEFPNKLGIQIDTYITPIHYKCSESNIIPGYLYNGNEYREINLLNYRNEKFYGDQKIMGHGQHSVMVDENNLVFQLSSQFSHPANEKECRFWWTIKPISDYVSNSEEYAYSEGTIRKKIHNDIDIEYTYHPKRGRWNIRHILKSKDAKDTDFSLSIFHSNTIEFIKQNDYLIFIKNKIDGSTYEFKKSLFYINEDMETVYHKEPIKLNLWYTDLNKLIIKYELTDSQKEFIRENTFINYTSDLQPNASNGYDTRILGPQDNWKYYNFGVNDALRCGKSSTSLNTSIHRSLIKFNGATNTYSDGLDMCDYFFVRAKLYLYTYGYGGTIPYTTHNTKIYGVKKDWDEGAYDGIEGRAANFISYKWDADAQDFLNWSTQGANHSSNDYDSLVYLGEFSYQDVNETGEGKDAGTEYSLEFTKSAYVTSLGSSYYGWIMRDDINWNSTTRATSIWCSSDHSTSSYRPKLSMTFHKQMLNTNPVKASNIGYVYDDISSGNEVSVGTVVGGTNISFNSLKGVIPDGTA